MAQDTKQLFTKLHNYVQSHNIPGGATTNLDPITYNPRYEGFDEANYRKLESKIDALWLTGSDKEKAMDELYLKVLPLVQNEIKNSDRRKIINNASYEASQLQDKDARMMAKGKLTVTELAQQLKEKFNIDPTANDEDVFNWWIQSIPDGWQLLANYMNDWDPALLYVWWLETRPNNQVQQWWVKNLINQASTSNKSWDEKSDWEKVETVTNYSNVIWLGTEKMDEAAGKFADKFLDIGNQALEKTTNSLQNKLNNMSQEEIDAYRKEFNRLVKNKSKQVAWLEWDTLVEQIWNWIKNNYKYPDSDEAFMEWLVSKKVNLGESLAWADDAIMWETNPNVIQFFGNIPSSAVKTFTATVRGMTNPYDTLKGLYKIAATDEGHQAILSRYWSWENFANAMNNDPVWVADDILAVAEVGTNIARWWLNFAGKVSGNTSLANAASNIPVIWSANDALAQKAVWGIYGAMDNAAKLSDSNIVQWVNRIVQDESSLSKMLQEWKTGIEKIENSQFWQAIKNAKEEFINKMTGLDEADRQFIRDNKKLVSDYMDWKKSVETVLDDVKNKIDEKQLANSEMGKEYDALREKGQTVDTQGLGSDMVDRLKKNKITINADWDLEFDKLSKYNASQQKALQDAWEVVKAAQAAENVDAGTILDLRQKLDDKLNRTWKPTELRNMSSVDKSTENLIKEMRGVIDTRAKAQIDGLAELDSKYAPALEEMRQIKKDWFDSDGKLRDNARSKIRNLTKGGNEERLSRLEKVAPWITQDLKALDVAQTIDRATKQGVGQYSKGILAWSIPAWIASPIAWLAGLWLWILTTPKNYVKLIEAYPDIVSKLEAWQELIPSDMERLQSLATRLQSWIE